MLTSKFLFFFLNAGQRKRVFWNGLADRSSLPRIRVRWRNREGGEAVASGGPLELLRATWHSGILTMLTRKYLFEDIYLA